MMHLLAFLRPLKCVCRLVTAFFLLAMLIFPAAAETALSPSAQSGSNGLMGEWGGNSSAGAYLSGQPTSGSNDQQGTTAPGTPTEASPPSAPAEDVDPQSSPSSAQQDAESAPAKIVPAEDAEPESSPPSAPQDAEPAAAKIAPAEDAEPESSPPSAPQDAEPAAAKILVVIDKPTQKMKIFVDSVERYSWEVSTGLRGYDTPSGEYTARSMNEIWYSKQWDDAPMPHAIFFTKKGHAVHGTNETKNLGKPASHGCVRLAPENARTLFALVKEKGLENTEIMLTGDTPKSEAKVATAGAHKQKVKQVTKSELKGKKRTGAARAASSRKKQINRPRQFVDRRFDPRDFEWARRFDRRDWASVYRARPPRMLPPPGYPPGRRFFIPEY
jgi:lipoprotein-anchoring transpeptidase ErfK/SrfK